MSVWMDVLAIFQCGSIAWKTCYLTMGRNNLTKLNEKTSCICGKAFQTWNSYGSGWEMHIIEELLFLFL